MHLQLTLEEALFLCERLAQSTSDGHITLYKFTTGWKVMQGTPDMSPYEREALAKLPGRMSLADAITDYLRKQENGCE